MNEQAAERAAAALAEARRAGKPMAAFAADCCPASVADGYAVQAAFRRLWQDRQAGWKIGATAKPIMDRFGLGEPFCGPFYATAVHASPARVQADRFNHLVIETEFAYRLGRELPARPQGYARDEILAAVDALIPAFELIDCRLSALPLDNGPVAVADCGLNGGMVLGSPVADWRDIDVPNHKVRLLVDGIAKGEGTGSLALGDPRNVLDWVVNKLSKDGVRLEKGQIFSTGTCTGVVALEKGQTAVGDFGALGTVEMRFE